ncbi:MAG: DUF1553 domain-containing protein [Bryobacteraceae bacterium]|nr:DUF1553 domain-containing protein [Bryobacteraceae bacterium]
MPALLVLLVLVTLPAGAQTGVEFNRDVRPILSDKCFGCHGPDAANKKIALRLDSEAAAKADLGGRRAVVEGSPESSELIRRITSAHKGLRMPPLASGHTLTSEQIETLKRWIAEGAKWQKHWALLTPVRRPPPEVRTGGWAKNPIDHFILERLEKEGLKPSAEASRETLLRRVSLDLTGLPPSPSEIEAFLKDESAGAYERAVTRLLASPRYGERMAIRWLDAARYADTNGYQFDGERTMWRWRDWVIQAFNANKPFDQFTLEQIAGDLLPGATLDQKIATGFNRNHRGNTEDGIIPEEYAVEYVVDRVETTSAVFLGLTMGCGRCHNHKYDPITQKEFYQFYAYFNNVPESGRAMKYGNSPPLVAAPTPDQQERLNAIARRIGETEAVLAGNAAEARRARAAWEEKIKSGAPVYWAPEVMLDGAFPLDFGSPGVVGSAASFDGRNPIDTNAAGQFDIDDRFSLSAWVRPDCSDCTLFGRHGATPRARGFGLHLESGKLSPRIINVWESDATKMESDARLEPGRWYHVAWTYDGSKMAAGHALFVDGRPVKLETKQDNLYRPFRNAGAKVSLPFRIAPFNFTGRMDDLRVYSRVLETEEIESLAVGRSLNEIAASPEAARARAEQRQLEWYFLDHASPDATRAAWKQLAALKGEREEFERTFPTSMIMAESPVRKRTHILNRGQYDRPGEEVEPGLPAALPPLPEGAPNNRLGFAKWLIDPANPLTARVTVNRLWQMVFGAGLVKTVEDFGQQGEWPSHPELLDWLATEFVRSGWDTKAMMRLMVTSAAYRQSSQATPDLIARDPENRLLARGPRFRLPAEMVRDSALSAAGLLTAKTGGPSVKPYQPEGLWKELIMQDMDYVQSKGADLYRRSLYTFWKRTVAPPMMANFDSALREACTVRESRTNTPLQALNMMNDVTFVEAARFIGQRMMKEGGADADSRLRHGFLLVTGRAPSASEMEVLRGNLRYHLDYFAGAAGKAEAYLKQGETPPDPKLPARDLAAYASVASLLLNLDEAITKE